MEDKSVWNHVHGRGVCRGLRVFQPRRRVSDPILNQTNEHQYIFNAFLFKSTESGGDTLSL